MNKKDINQCETGEVITNRPTSEPFAVRIYKKTIDTIIGDKQ